LATLYTNFIDALSGETRRMLVEDGRVVWNTTDPHVTSDAPAMDLGGSRVLPKFIDAHCHILPGGLDLQKLNLTAFQTKEEVLDAVRERHQSHPEGWLMAVHYDQTKFDDGHLSRIDLDKIDSHRPILLRHSNGHASVANTAALVAAGITRDTTDPKGGTYVRDASGDLTGVLLEKAHEIVTAAAPSPTLEQMTDAILAAGERMSKLGIGAATDMMTGRYNLPLELEAYRLAAEKGNPVRVRLCMQWGEVFRPAASGGRAVPVELAEHFQRVQDWDQNRLRIWGIKIFADGAIGSATAAIYGRYTGSSEDVTEDGTLMYAPERLREMVRIADAAGFPIAIHTIGDRSTDLVMEAYEALGDASRHRIEHAMILSDTQIERLARLGAHVTMQPEFLHRFGHAYRRQLGADRASRLKRVRSVLDAGISLSFNSDFPIVPGEPWIGIDTASNRPEGFDPSENCTRDEAIRAYTVMGAVANHEADLMGELKAGQLADFQLVD